MQQKQTWDIFPNQTHVNINLLSSTRCKWKKFKPNQEQRLHALCRIQTWAKENVGERRRENHIFKWVSSITEVDE